MRIVHLSDIHLSDSGLLDTEEFVIKALVKDLIKFNNETPIDLIVFSGDLIDKGGASFQKDIELAFLTFEDKIISPIVNVLNLPKERFFFVPGNHDIDRSADSPIAEQGLERYLSSTEKFNEYYDRKDIEGRKRILPFKSFEKAYYSSYPNEYELTDFHSNFKLNIDGIKVGITCFNSSWRCFDSDVDRGKLILGERQVISSRRFLNDCEIKLAIVHHPLDWLATFEKKAIETMITREYKLLFCGHVHEGESWKMTNMYGDLFVSVAPANWTNQLRTNDRTYANGYSIIDYDHTYRKVTIHNRRYAYLKECYDPNTDLGDHNGVNEYEFPDSKELGIRNKQIEIANSIKNVHIQGINEHLLSFYTDTSAPKKLEEIFVLPRIIHETQYDVEEEKKEKNYKLEDLCSSEKNLLLTGTKESGKTILLDRLLIEFVDNINKYRKIPVYLNFEEITNSRIETLISRYLNVGILEVPKLLENQKVVLLLDNISFTKSKHYTLKNLEAFIFSNPNIRIIATYTNNIEGDVPLEIFDYPVIAAFKNLQIKNFNTKEIRELIKNWFINDSNYDAPEKLEKILKVLVALNIPRTPLSVSMFLWIIEQQENYKPVNNATMLENFVQKLLQKLSRNEIYSERFDYKNKERLLTGIAFRMYKTNDVSYRMVYNELRNYIYEYLRIRKFDFEAEEVLQHFIAKGVLITEKEGFEIYIRFRFTCFFQYFLMKNMEFKPDFEDFVLSEENFLFFIDEIDYYTGLKRDRADILEVLVGRMNDAYREILEKVNNLEMGFDTVFETKRTITRTLDNNFVKRITQRKPTEDELDEIKDNALESQKSEKGIVKKEEEITPLQKLERLWVIAAKVLKNTEETEVEHLKSNAFKDIIHCSMAYSTVHKILLNDFLNKNKDGELSIDNEDLLKMMKRFMPLINQLVTFSVIGTGKLNIVIREAIEQKIEQSNVSDYEKYMLTFLYCDLKGRDYHKYIKKLIKNVQSSYIFDMILFKIVSYYYMRSNSSWDGFYENLIGEIITKSKGLKKAKKGEIIVEYRDRKKVYIKEENYEYSLDA